MKALEKLPAKDVDRAQSAAQNALAVSIFFLPAKALIYDMGAFAARQPQGTLGSTGTSNIFFQLSWPEFRA